MNFVESLYSFVIFINEMLRQLIFPPHVISKDMLLVNIRDHTRFVFHRSNWDHLTSVSISVTFACFGAYREIRIAFIFILT